MINQPHQAPAPLRLRASARRSRSIISSRPGALLCRDCDLCSHAHTVRSHVQRRSRQSRARAVYRLRSARRCAIIAFSLAGFFAGIAGALAAINFELANSADLGAVQSGFVLLADLYRRGRIFHRTDHRRRACHLSPGDAQRRDRRCGSFISGCCSSLVVMFAPGGIAGLFMMHRAAVACPRLRNDAAAHAGLSARACRRRSCCLPCSSL